MTSSTAINHSSIPAMVWASSMPYASIYILTTTARPLVTSQPSDPAPSTMVNRSNLSANTFEISPADSLAPVTQLARTSSLYTSSVLFSREPTARPRASRDSRRTSYTRNLCSPTSHSTPSPTKFTLSWKMTGFLKTAWPFVYPPA